LLTLVVDRRANTQVLRKAQIAEAALAVLAVVYAVSLVLAVMPFS
jgi:hypothetical protein